MASTDEGKATPQPKKSPGEALRESLRETGQTFVHLVRAPRALWGLNVSYFFEGLVYFGILTILGKYLSEDVGLADLHSGWVYSIFTAGITLAMLFLGGVADRVGVRRALLASLALMVAGRFLLALSGSLFEYGQGPGSAMFFTVAAGLLVVVVGYGMYQPAAYAGVKQYTNRRTSTIGYAMLYAVMNLGAFVSGLLSPPVRHASGMVGVYWVYVGLTLLALLSIVFLLSRRTAQAAIERVAREDAADPDNPSEPADATAPKPARAPGARLMTPAPLLLSAALGVGAVALVALAVMAPVAPHERGLRDHARALKDWSRAVAALPEGASPAAAAQALGAPVERAASAAAAVVAPSDPGLAVDPFAFAVVQAKLAADLALLRAPLPAPAAEPAPAAAPAAAEGRASGAAPTGPSDTKTAALRLRQHAVRVMALAYGLVASPDRGAGAHAEDLDKVRRRLKQPADPPVPLTPAEESETLEAMGLAPAALLLRLADWTTALHERSALELPPAPAAVIGETLRLQAAAARQLAAVADKPGAAGRDVLVLCLSAQAGLLVGWANELATADTAPTALALIEAKVGHDVETATELADALAAAARAPLAVRAQAFLLRYGILGLGLLVALIALVTILLRRRPDHPLRDARFTFFIFVLIPVQTLFAHNWLTLPYYINRSFAGTAVGENFELFSNLNPILIFVITPVVAALTARAKVYRMMIVGCLVMALPTFLLALPPNVWLLIAYTVLMTFGEALWQPRFLQWVAEIAPSDRTGAYMGIAQFPWFLTKFLTGMYSGYFVARYVPAVGVENPEFMWFIYGLIAMVSPVALFLARKWMGVGLDRKHT